MFDRLLLPLDGSTAAEAAIPYAELIPSERVRLVRIEPERDPIAPAAGPDAEPEAYLRAAGAAFERQGRLVETVVAPGDPAGRIVELAGDCDLIVMTTHGRGAGGRLLFGSVADQVVRRATAATLVVRAAADRAGAHQAAAAKPPLTRLVVPLDGSPLAERATPVAARLADLLGLPVHLVRVVEADPVRDAVQAGSAAAAAQRRRVAEDRVAAESYLAAEVQSLRNRDLTATSEVRQGAPIDELVGALRPTDLVVMSTHGLGGLRRWLIGSVAEHLVRAAPAPILLVRPSPEDQSAELSDSD